MTEKKLVCAHCQGESITKIFGIIYICDRCEGNNRFFRPVDNIVIFPMNASFASFQRARRNKIIEVIYSQMSIRFPVTYRALDIQACLDEALSNAVDSGLAGLGRHVLKARIMEELQAEGFRIEREGDAQFIRGSLSNRLSVCDYILRFRAEDNGF